MNTPREAERKRQVIGLLLIALIILMASLWRSGLRVLLAGRPW